MARPYGLDTRNALAEWRWRVVMMIERVECQIPTPDLPLPARSPHSLRAARAVGRSAFRRCTLVAVGTHSGSIAERGCLRSGISS